MKYINAVRKALAKWIYFPVFAEVEVLKRERDSHLDKLARLRFAMRMIHTVSEDA